MAERKTAAQRIAELEDELRQRDDKIKELAKEKDEALELVDRMREHVEDVNQTIDQVIEVFDMKQNDHGVWVFDKNQKALLDLHIELIETHNKLVRDWNKLIPKYNAAVNPQPIGRPLAASEAQQADVLKRHKAGASLRAIALATSLSLRTVRTIIDRANNKGRTGKRNRLLRHREFDRLRAASYRAKKRTRDGLPKQIGELQNAGEAVVKAAKGLGQ